MIPAGLSIPDDYDESKEENTEGDDEKFTTIAKNLVHEVTAIVGQLTTLLCNFEDPGNRTVSTNY